MTITKPARRAAWLSGAALLAFAGCARDPQQRPATDAAADGPGIHADLAVPGDLSLAPGDLAMEAADFAGSTVDASPRPDLPRLESCYAIHECIITTCAPGTIKVCAPECMARGTMDAMKWFGPLLQCAAPKCFGGGDCAVPNEPDCNLCFTINCFQELMDCFNHG